jgi:RND family efflux transporter MFP subunit
LNWLWVGVTAKPVSIFNHFINSMNKIVLLFSIVVGFAACTPNKEEKTEAGKFPITSPLARDTNYTSEYVAEIQSLQNVEIRAKIKGYIEKIYVDEGKPAKAGQTLFSISNKEFNQELLKAKAMLKSAIAEAKNAELELQSVKKLSDKNIVSKTELEKAQANLDAANAKIDEAKANEASANINLSFAEIKAPFDGTLNRIPFKAGSLIDEGTLLTTLSNNKEVFAYFNVSEKEYLGYTTQKENGEEGNITLLLANGQANKYKGTVETIEGEFDKNTGNIAFRAKFPNPDLLLKHGSSGKVQLTNNIKNALLIPQKATFEIQDKFYVFVVDANNVVKQRNIVIKQRLPQLYVIESGISANDKIIYEGIQTVKEGDKILTDFVPMQQVISQLKTQ